MIGLISKANVDCCESLGCYYRVLTYERLDQIARDTPCAYIDFAGNSALRMRTHSQLANLKYSCPVVARMLIYLKITSAKKGAGKDMPNVRATLFFAPAQTKKRSAEWGAVGLRNRLSAAWQVVTRKSCSHTRPGWWCSSTKAVPVLMRCTRKCWVVAATRVSGIS